MKPYTLETIQAISFFRHFPQCKWVSLENGNVIFEGSSNFSARSPAFHRVIFCDEIPMSNWFTSKREALAHCYKFNQRHELVKLKSVDPKNPVLI